MTRGLTVSGSVNFRSAVTARPPNPTQPYPTAHTPIHAGSRCQALWSDLSANLAGVNMYDTLEDCFHADGPYGGWRRGFMLCEKTASARAGRALHWGVDCLERAFHCIGVGGTMGGGCACFRA